MIRFRFSSLLLALFVLLSGVLPGLAGEIPLLILHNNDLHGQYEPLPTLEPGATRGGLAALKNAYLQEKLRAALAGIPVLQFDGGDVFQGTPVGDFTRGEGIFSLYAAMGYDAGVPGNHDFDITARELAAKARQLGYPLVCCNIRERKSGRTPSFLRPYFLRNISGLRVGITGVIVEDLAQVTRVSGVRELRVQKPENALPSVIRRMRRAGARLIIVLSHVGIERDREIAAAVEGIDLLFGAHTHTGLTRPEQVNGTMIMQSGSKGQFYTRLRLLLDDRTGKILHHEHRLVTVTERTYGRHQGMANRIAAIAEPIMAPLRQEVGRSLRHLVKVSGPIATPEQAREVRETRDRFPWGLSLLELPDGSVHVVETNLSQLVADAFAEATGSPIAVTNLTGIRAGKMPGPITRLDACKILPFENFLWEVEMTGRDLRELFLQDKKRYRSTFLQVSGLEVEFAVQADGSIQLASLRHAGREVEDGERYRVCTNNFLAGGGDGYLAFTRGRVTQKSGILMRDALIRYLQKRGTVDPLLKPRLTFRR